MKKNRMNDFSKFLMLAALIILMAGGYIVNRKKLQLREAANLPYYKVELSEIEDGIYTKDIKVLQNDGIDGEKARPIIHEMIAQNKIVVPAIKGAERGSLVYVSCASTALARK